MSFGSRGFHRGSPFCIEMRSVSFEIQMRFSHGNLLPFIALQMALTVAGVNRFFSCSACGKLYVRKEQRTPNKGQANYCSAEACKKEALRRADQNRRMRVIKARELNASGVSGPK